jgi:hypothetical protein
MGVGSDFVNAFTKNMTFGQVRIDKNWADKQTSIEPTAFPSASKLPNAAKAVSVKEAFDANPNLQSYLQGVAKLETRGGKSTIKGPGGEDSNNLYNIKDFSKTGSGFRAYDKAERSNDRYRTYGSREESTADMINLLARKYPGALTAKTPQDFAMALKAGGYATDPSYVSKLTNTIKSPTTPGVDILAGGSAPSTASTLAKTASTFTGAEPSTMLTELQKQTTLLGSMVALLGKTPPSGKGWQMSREEGINKGSGS